MNDTLDTTNRFTAQNTADRLSFFLDSAGYYAALDEVLRNATRRILIVGWAFDDRVRLVRTAEPDGPERTVGEILLDRASEDPRLHVQLCIWQSPAVFSGDQHFSASFRRRAEELHNVHLDFIPSRSVLNTRHEKYVIVDDLLAFMGGIDISHNRWDTADHRGDNPDRVNPSGEPYIPYHDTQVVCTGPIVRDLYSLASRELPVTGTWNPAEGDLWPSGLPVEMENVPVNLSITRASTDREHADKQDGIFQIKQLYLEMIRNARRSVYIENQYFSSDGVTEALCSLLRKEKGPEVIIIMSRELPDALGRLTMGANASQHLSSLIEADIHNHLGFFNVMAPDNPQVDIKVHSKLMIVDGRHLTLGSANISRRSFHFDDEINLSIDAEETSDPRCVARLEERLLAQHCGLSVPQWQEEVARCNNSRVTALRERSRRWAGLAEGRDSLAPERVPRELLEYADMRHPPETETLVQRLVASDPVGFIVRTRKTWGVFLLAVVLLGSAFFLARTEVDVEEVLQSIRHINEDRPLLAGLLTVLAYWLSIAVFVTIVVPIVFFAALHGPAWGILYSTIGLFTGGALFYALGLALHNSDLLNRYNAVRRAREQFEKVKPYGTWAVAISRMVPSGPFLVVNLVTGMLGFSPRQFLLGSAIGLAPGIIALSVFGEIVRTVFTDPSLVNTLIFVAFLGVYFLLIQGTVSLIKRFTGPDAADQAG